MYLVEMKNLNISIDKLIQPIVKEIETFLFIEFAAGKHVGSSQKALNVLKELKPHLIKEDTRWKDQNFSNINYTFTFDSLSQAILQKHGEKASDWNFPELYDDLTFLRRNQKIILYTSAFNKKIQYFVDDKELEIILREHKSLVEKTTDFKTFLTNLENEFLDPIAWDIIKNDYA